MSSLSAEHEEVRRAVRQFTEEEVVPIADPYDQANKEIPAGLIKKMGDLGYFGLIFPPEYGGAGMDYVSMAIVTEELSRGWLSVGSVATRNLITGTLLLAHGTEEQKRRFLPKIASGEILTAAAFTEPDAGSDTASIKTRARKDGEAYLISGAKTWCTFANRAHILTLMARTDPEPAKRHKGLSILLVEKEPGDGFDPPVISGEPIKTIGYHGMRSFSLSLQDCPVPAKNLIGGVENKGFYQLMATYESARIQTAARAVGVAQAAFEAALKYSKERVQFGQPIASFQAIRHKLADMATEIEAARRLTYYACEMKDRGARCDLEAGMAKVFAAEMAERVTSEAMQVFGGYGYSQEFPVQRYWRDARVFRIFEGTSEIQREVIAKRLLEG
ncbi:MAG: acyl-CoA dehydrogenase family protein [Candidatus Methylomirabilis oxyfera]|nr:acyl-CoA dehydrogenase family protein [Candidatus Methylomirabilis oxyfera]